MNALVVAAQDGRLDEVKNLVWQGGDINGQSASGWTPLIASAARGHTEILAFLLENGADPNKTNARGTTPIMYAKTVAFASGNLRALNLLVEKGADISAVDSTGLSALDYEADSGQVLTHLKTPLYASDTLERFAARHYDNEIWLLTHFELFLKQGNLYDLKTTEARKRMSMKREADLLAKFEDYKREYARG